MSKAALYKGLSAGLMTFGQGMAQQIAMDAERRRKESLLALERQWKLEDRADERAYQQSVLADQRAYSEGLLADERAYQSEQDEIARAREIEDRDHMTPVDQARIGLLTAQAENVGQNRTPRSRIDLYEQFIGNGDDHETATQKVQDIFSSGVAASQADPRQQMWGDALDRATKIVGDGWFDPTEYGLPEETTRMDAINLLAESYMNQMQSLPGGAESQGGDGTRNNPIPVESLSGPGDLMPGRFYMVNGQLREWTGSEWR